MMRDTRLEVDLDAIEHNVGVVRSLLQSGPASAHSGAAPALAAVLKADAYGLGALAVAGALLKAGAELLAVACLPEALELRERYPDAPLLVMGHTPDRLLAQAAEARVACTIFDERQARLLSEAAARAGRAAAVHIKLDTGMNRLGHKPGDGDRELFGRLAALPGLDVQGVFSHLALRDGESDRAQYELFQATVRVMEEAGLRPPLRHICDSIGLMRYPEYRMDMVRAGAVLYGVTPLNTPLSSSVDIRVPFALRTRISRLRELKPGEGVGYDYSWRAPEGGAFLATLPVGYADGYRRCLGNKGFVLVRGRLAPVVGLVCMDQCTVDLSAIPEAREGDEVLLLGRGPEGDVPILDMAAWAATNRNEILSGIGRRVPRLYRRGGALISCRDYLMDREESYGPF